MDKVPLDELLDPDAISSAEALGLHARQIVEGYIAGEHKSPYHGFAIEFAQHREYSAGDDIRHLDWKVLGRTERYYIKQYEQETNYVGHILLDGSESMKYGSGKATKFAYGKMLAACLSYTILRQRDAVALNIFDTRARQYLPRSNNHTMIQKVLGTLAAQEPLGHTNIAAILHDMARQIQRRGIVFVISDLFDDEQTVMDGIQHLRFGGNEVVVFHVLDPAEIEFKFEGLVEFEGLEDIPTIKTRPQEIRKSYLAEFNAFCDRIREGCERNQCHYLRVNTGQPFSEVLSGYLAFRLKTSRK
ncbi:MAG: DUF58 domain-containing protein [Verrucomicrobiales bacterium]|nr:DUF58 domain-containing protein [Verrucomicrobiales bacterium]|tara:strand:+ start:13171 stop:14076 length:906 start_codon:yes stop_codon:yes gene_type:complete